MISIVTSTTSYSGFSHCMTYSSVWGDWIRRVVRRPTCVMQEGCDARAGAARALARPGGRRAPGGARSHRAHPEVRSIGVSLTSSVHSTGMAGSSELRTEQYFVTASSTARSA